MKKQTSRSLCLLLSIVMIFSLLPVSALAADVAENGDISTPTDGGLTSQTDGELTIPGYTRVTELPSDGLEEGQYLIVATYDNQYYMLYPAAYGVAAYAKNSARLVVGAGGQATGYQVGYGTTYGSAAVSTNFDFAENTITNHGSEYTIAAGSYCLKCGDGVPNGIYQASGANLTIEEESESGCFRIKGIANLLFYSTNMNFNQAKDLEDSKSAAYFPDMMLFKRDGKVTMTTAPVIPGYTQLTDISNLDQNKGYLIVSQDQEGNIYALYPSVDGEYQKSGDLVAPGSADEGVRAAALTVADKNVTAKWMKDNSSKAMKMLLFSIKKYDDNKYVFTAFNGRHLNMQDYMFTVDSVALTVTSRGDEAPDAFKIHNPDADGGGRVLDFTKTGDRNAFNGPTFGTDFWCPRECNMPVYLYYSNTEDKIPTAKDWIIFLLGEIGNEQLNEADYTAASWSAFEKAKTAAEAVLNPEEEEDDGDAQVYVTARDALRDAFDGLIKKIEIPEVPDWVTPISDWKTMVPGTGATTGQPYIAGRTGGSDNFRIPAMITLQHQSGKNESKNGRLVTAMDARWDHTGDACALDTVVSYSDDYGANWNYNFPNYFGDSTDAKANNATAFIDPVLVEGNDGTIYLMVDLWPGGVALNTAPMRPAASTGYVDIDGSGTKRLALYTSPVTGSQTDTNYIYYIGDFEGDFAPVYEPKKDTDDIFAGYYVDEYYYLYHTRNEFRGKEPEKDKIYCKRLGSDEWVQQNIFFYNATLHARNASYLWIVKSTDGGETWSKPRMINRQVRSEEKGDWQFYGVGPGAGLCVETKGEAGAIPNGTIILPTYVNPDERAGFIYSTDKGATWQRGNDATTDQSSESCLVQIDDTTIRQFYRDNGYSTIRYTDHAWNGSGWTTGSPVFTDAIKTTGCQLSAIKYSKKVNGKDAIILSTAASGNSDRSTGKLYVFLVNNNADHTMELYKTYDVTDDGAYYCYSSLSETADGDIALLYEYAAAAATFGIIRGSDLVPTLDLTVTGWEGEYDGKEHAVIARASDMQAGLYFSTDGGNTWGKKYVIPAFTNAGTYNVKVKAVLDDLTGEASAITKEASATVTIREATPTLTITTDKESYTADEIATFTVSGVPDEGTVTLRCSNTAEDHDPVIELAKQGEGTWTGTHDVKNGNQRFTATYAKTANYTAATAAYSLTVAPAEFGLNAKDVSKIYDGKPQSIKITVADGVSLTYCDTAEKAEADEYTDEEPEYTDVGTHTIYFKATKGTESVTGSVDLTITKATPKITFKCNQEEAHGSDGEHEIETKDLPLVLTIDGVPAENQGRFTLTTFGEPVKNLERKSDGTWTASPNLPRIARTYTFTAAFDPRQTQGETAISNPNYNSTKETFTVNVARSSNELVDFSFNFTGKVVTDSQNSNKGTLTIPYDGTIHSPLEALDYDRNRDLVLSYRVHTENAGEVGSDGPWDYSEPTFWQPGTYSVSVMASPANSPVTKVLTVELVIDNSKDVSVNLTITPSASTLPGGGKVTLTVGGMPAAGTLTVSCDNKTATITRKSRGTYEVTLPNASETYTFTAEYLGVGSYQNATKTCEVVVTAVAKLSALTLSAGSDTVPLNAPFNPNTTFYTASVENEVKSVTVTATAADGTAVVRKGGETCENGKVNLTEDENVVTVVVTNGGTSAEYTITIIRAAKDNVVASAENVSATYNGERHGITVNVSKPASGYTVTYSTEENGSFTATQPECIKVGTYTIYYKVEADGMTAATGSATVTITAVPQPDAPKLKSLSLSPGTLDPVFDADTLIYTANVENSVERVTVTATAADNDATVVIKKDGNVCKDGIVDLDVGDNEVTVTVSKSTVSAAADIDDADTHADDTNDSITEAVETLDADAEDEVAETEAIEAEGTEVADTEAEVAEDEAAEDEGTEGEAIEGEVAEDEGTEAEDAEDEDNVGVAIEAEDVGDKDNDGEDSEGEADDGTDTDAKVYTIIITRAKETPSGVELNMTTASLNVNETVNLSATVLPENATNKSVIWSSSNETVATVDENGKVTAKTAGSAAITVTTADGGFTATCAVTVTAPASEPESSDSSGGGASSRPTTPTTNTTTTTNPDGSTTTTVTDNKTGTVTETTTEPDGSRIEKVTTPEKNVVIIVIDSNGEILAKVELPYEIPAPATRFADVPEGHWAYGAVYTMAGLKLVNGVGGGLFDPNGNMKRGDLALILSRMSNIGDGYKTSFADVPADKYYANGVAWAAKVDVVTGRGENSFAPEDTVTREELAVMLCRYARLLKLDIKVTEDALGVFADGKSVHDWAEEGMAWCVENGILQGKGDGILDPRTNVTRAEVTVMFQRFMDLLRECAASKA